MRILFWGSSDFSIPSLAILNKNHEICAVVTNPDSVCGRGMKKICRTVVKNFAIAHRINLIQPASLKDESLIEKLTLLKPDLSVVASFGMILPEKVLNIPVYRSINVHASLLPRYRGASPIQAALEHGEKVTGVTIQFMSKELDRGDIILQKEIEIRQEDNYKSLSARLASEGAMLLNDAVRIIETGKCTPYKQDDNAATFTRMLKKEDGRIDFTKLSAREILNKWKAYIEWPGIYTEYRSSEIDKTAAPAHNISLIEICILDEISQMQQPGTIIEADKKGLVIQCREGRLSLMKLKPWGKKEMDYISFINGYKPVNGRIF
jgi:methionyl-tRNA formyltransferase